MLLEEHDRLEGEYVFTVPSCFAESLPQGSCAFGEFRWDGFEVDQGELLEHDSYFSV